MRSTSRGAVVPAVLSAFAPFAERALAQDPPVFRLLAQSGGAYPGRPGCVYEDQIGSPFLGDRSMDTNGDLYFLGRGRRADNSTFSDLLVYRQSTQTVEPLIQDGDVIGGFPATVFWGTSGGSQVGMIAHLALLKDPVFGERQAVVVSWADGTRFVAARDLDQPPGYPLAAGLKDIGLSLGSFLDVNMNRVGTVAYGGRFLDQAAVQRYGYYLARPDGVPERIIDSTMEVPGHPGAAWATFDGSSTPFDLSTPGLDEAGNAYFRAKYRENAKDYRIFYKRSIDGEFTAIADAGRSDQVPGLPGHYFHRVNQAANNQGSEVVFSAEVYKPNGLPLGTGAYRLRDGEALTRLLLVGDAVPGIPEASDISVGLGSINDGGHVLLKVNYFLPFPNGSLGGQSLVLYNPDGRAEPVLRFDQTPGFPGERAGGISQAAAINSFGDVLFGTRMNTITPSSAAFVYLNESNTLVPILKTGDPLDGLTVVSFVLGSFGPAAETLGAIAPSGGAVTWDDSRRFSMRVTLKDAAGKQADALYFVSIPGPACPADFDGNGFVNGDDYDAFVSAFDTGGPTADLDGNGFVNGDDFDLFAARFVAGC